MWHSWQRWLGLLCLAALLILCVPRQGLPPMVGKPDWQEAMPLLEQQARQPGADRAVQARLIDGYLALGQNQQALSLLARSADTLAVRERRQLTRLAVATRQPELAVKSLLPLRSELADDELRNLAGLALHSRDPQSAGRAYETLLSRHPSDQTAREQLVAVRLAEQRPDRALDCFEAGRPWAKAQAWHRRAAQLADWANEPARAVPHRLAIYAASATPSDGKQALGALCAAQDPRATGFAVRLVLDTADGDICTQAVDRLMQTGARAQALRLLLWRAERLPGDSQAHQAALALAMGERHLLTAIAEQRRWIARNPSADAWHQLATLYAHANSPESALGAYAKAFVGAPPQELAWRHEALALASPQDDMRASGRENLKRLSVLDARNALVWRRLAEAEATTGDWPAAVAAQHRAIALAPTREDEARLARWLLRAHPSDVAVRTPQRGQPLTEDALTQVARVAAMAVGRNSDARGTLPLAKAEASPANAHLARLPAVPVVESPGGLDLVEAHAAALEHLGHEREALALWRHLYVTQPRRLPPALAVARLALAEGDLSLASAAYWRSNALAPRALATRLLGIDYLEATGHERMALTAIRELRRSDPGWRDGALREAQANELLGEHRPAWHLGRKEFGLNPNDGDVRTWIDGLREDGAAKLALRADWRPYAWLYAAGPAQATVWRDGTVASAVTPSARNKSSACG